MGMYGTSKLYLLMFIPGLQQRLRVSHVAAVLATVQSMEFTTENCMVTVY